MPRITGTSNAQSKFLRCLRRQVGGISRSDWPSPAVLARWLRQPAFVKQLKELREILQFQTEIEALLAVPSAREIVKVACRPRARMPAHMRALFRTLRLVKRGPRGANPVNLAILTQDVR